MRCSQTLNLTPFAWLFVLTLLLGAAHAYEEGGELGPLARRIAGGASVLADLSRSSAAERFHERAHRFEEAAGEGPSARMADDWRDLREAFEEVRHERLGGDARMDFLFAHLQQDVAQGDSLIGRLSAASETPPPRNLGAGTERISFVDRKTCVGTTAAGRPCPASRDSVTFRIPRDVAIIRRLDVEWRDFGANSNAEIYVNDRFVSRTDVSTDWNTAVVPLNVRIAPGSTLTIRSADGDPIWIRRLTADTLSAPRPEQSYRDPWDFFWQERR